MTNRKSKTIRKIGPASTGSILPSPARRRRTCVAAKNGTPKLSTPVSKPSAPSESRNTQHAPRTRNGKVARLPYSVRDMINRMLRNNIPHSQIVDALDELQFKVTERNISNWKTRGGYHDWCIAQDRALETRLLQDNLLEHLRKNDASQLAEVGLQLAATELSQFFLKSETRQQLNAEPEKLSRTIGILCRLARQIHILQKHRDQSAKELGPEHNPEHLKRETDDTLESIRNTYSAEKPSQSIKEPEVPHRNFLPKNGFPPDPPPLPEPDYAEIHYRNFQELCDLIAKKNAERIAKAEAAYRTTPLGSAAPAASSDFPEPDHSDEPDSPAAETSGAATSDSSPGPQHSDGPITTLDPPAQQVP
jgi:hypothetical protein